jgi:EmrB/QacA subfamily drug resistance transporter
MTTAPVTRPASPHRGLALAMLCLSVCVIVMDGTIVNITLPTLLRELGGGATTRQLQWIVDAYVLVFAGLLMAAGSLGDRFGRKRLLLIGLLLFAACSAGAGSAPDAPSLITWRALMGIGAALIFPATLALIVNLFPEPRERDRAIGAWAAMSGVGVAIGPAAGGFILEHASWGWVFFINVPLCLAIACIAVFAVQESKDHLTRPLDGLGTLLSFIAVGSLTYAIIEAPQVGWTHPQTLGFMAASGVLMVLFIAWELHCPAPMLDLALFRRRTFAAGSFGIATAFFGLFGLVFLVTQYFQLVRGYGPLESGLRTLPFALFTGITAPFAPLLARRLGCRWVIAIGLALMGLSCGLIAADDATTPYPVIILQMLPLGMGLGLVNATGTDTIMAGLPREKAGIGSAVNDTARELGGTLGVAAMGSLFSSLYVATLAQQLADAPLPDGVLAMCQSSVAAAQEVARQAGILAGPLAEDAFRSVLIEAFLEGFRDACLLGAGLLMFGAIACLRALPPLAPLIGPGPGKA